MSNRILFAFPAVALMFAVGTAPAAHAQLQSAGRTTPVCCVVSSVPLTEVEAKRLLFMREEEKLARDVYTQLYAKWQLRLFDNIARSETRHTETVESLVARYVIADPGKSLPAGSYADPALSALYFKLVEKGLQSIKDALEVGVLIEQQDISDLEAALKETTRTDIKTVYTNLLSGSLSHLESFETVLEIVAP